MVTLALLFSLAAAPWAPGGASRPEDLRITLVTFSPGDSLTEWWGHTAVVVQDVGLRDERLYNYGMFGFDDGFVHRFMQGRLEFWVAEDPVLASYEFYKQRLNRDVRLQELDLTPSEAKAVAESLAVNVEPANRTYLYHHYHDNCSTRPRDIIDRAVKGQLIAATAGPARMSLREHTRRYSAVNPAMSVVLDFLQNDELERPIAQKHEAFLPDELERQVSSLTVTHDDGRVGPLVRRQSNWYQSPRLRPPEKAPNWLLSLFAVGASFTLVALALGHWGRGGARLPRILLGFQVTLLGLVGGVLGVVLLLAGVFTNHTVTHRNENVLCFSPLLLAAVPLGVLFMLGRAKATSWLRWLFFACAVLNVVGLGLKLLPMFDQANGNVVALALPLNIGMAVLFSLAARPVSQTK